MPPLTLGVALSGTVGSAIRQRALLWLAFSSGLLPAQFIARRDDRRRTLLTFGRSALLPAPALERAERRVRRPRPRGLGDYAGLESFADLA